MKYINCKMSRFRQIIGSKRVICFGASSVLQRYYEDYSDWFEQWRDQMLFFIDNDEKKWGAQYELGGRAYPIYSVSKLKDLDGDNTVVIITASPKYMEAICGDLEEFGNLQSSLCFALELMFNLDQIDDSRIESVLGADSPIINSKVIHTFWFSRDKIPEKYQKCVDSWKQYCPEYEIKLWNSDNYDVTKNTYMYEAYQRKQWAFAADYARLDVIYRYGGIYMDMDVEVLRNLDDLLKLPCFFGIDTQKLIDLGSGFGALKGNTLIKQLMERYDDLKFCLEDGQFNRAVQPRFLLDTFLQHGYQLSRDSQVVNGAVFLSANYFRINEGKKNCFSGKEYLIHWHNAGWWSEEERAQRYKGRQEPLAKMEKRFEYKE